jgi:hypothetical protein
MAVPPLTYGSEISTIYIKEAKIETAEMEFSKCVADYARKDEIRTERTKIREELNIFILNNKILK